MQAEKNGSGRADEDIGRHPRNHEIMPKLLSRENETEVLDRRRQLQQEGARGGQRHRLSRQKKRSRDFFGSRFYHTTVSRLVGLSVWRAVASRDHDLTFADILDSLEPLPTLTY